MSSSGKFTPSEEETEDEAIRRVEAEVEAEYNKLKALGGRPVCSLEEWHQWVKDPFVVASPGSVDFKAWHSCSCDIGGPFLRWQLFHRGREDDMTTQEAVQAAIRDPDRSPFNPFAAFVDFQDPTYRRSMNDEQSPEEQERRLQDLRYRWGVLPDPDTIHTVRKQGLMFGSRARQEKKRSEAASGASIDGPATVFESYCRDVKARLSPYYLRHEPVLLMDTHQQSPLTTWMEFLSFELAYLEPYFEARSEHAETYASAWTTLKGSVKRERMANSKTTEPVDTAAHDIDSAQADSQKEGYPIRTFILRTMNYRNSDSRVQLLQSRIQWIISEARAVEAEVEAMAKSVIDMEGKET